MPARTATSENPLDSHIGVILVFCLVRNSGFEASCLPYLASFHVRYF